jgi:cyclophilin family peptidyl-prolyl cis-trans isomerase
MPALQTRRSGSDARPEQREDRSPLFDLPNVLVHLAGMRLAPLRGSILALLALVVLSVRPAGAQTGPLVRLDSNLGTFEMELLQSNAPVTTANFLKYVSSGRYDGTIVHRSVPNFVLQAGGFAIRSDGITPVPIFGTITNEPGISNLRGTVAMAKQGGNPHSATSQWFINLGDNSANLDVQNGGFTVFARVFGNGMRVAEAMRAVPVYDASGVDGAFGEIPLLGEPDADKTFDDLLVFRRVAKLPVSTVAVSYDFTSSDHGFAAGFADLPADYDAAIYELQSGHRELPEKLGSGKALFISGANRSDDLWMYWQKRVTGLVPGRLYEVAMDLEFASSYAEGLVGIGGPPGEAVTLKMGAVARKPRARADTQGWLRMNLDKGNQSAGGRDLVVVGDVAKPDDGTEDYVLLHRDNRAARQTVRAAADGSLWLVFGTDSGFEGTTALYFTKFSAVLVPAQTIAFPAFPPKHFKSRPFVLAARASTGLPLVFSSSNPDVATIEGRRVTIRGVGETVITATQAGDSRWQPAAVARTLQVGKFRPRIVFRPPARVARGASFELQARSTSGATHFNFRAEPDGILQIEGNRATAVGAGPVDVIAEQSATDTFEAASARRTMVVR